MSGISSIEHRRRIGQVVAGRYELAALVGVGGQGAVYRAHDREGGGVVAIKILVAQDAAAAERMYREARVMAELKGTAAVQVLDHLVAPDGAHALVMELLHGKNLADVLEEREAEGTRADRAWVERVFAPIVDTLEAAHARGIVHRDLKPGNVFVVDDAHGGGVRLLDFGFAKLLHAGAITAAEMVAGSPSYLAPEVWAKGSLYADRLVDVYALGVILFRVLGGRLPFSGDLVDLMRATTGAPRPSLRALRPDLGPHVDAWVEQVLAIKPERRFQRPLSAWRALQACF